MACAFSAGWATFGTAALLAEAAVAGRNTPDFLAGDENDEAIGGSELPPLAL
jgi:hypothetical protein